MKSFHSLQKTVASQKFQLYEKKMPIKHKSMLVFSDFLTNNKFPIKSKKMPIHDAKL